MSVSMSAINEFWNCAVTVSGCFLVLTAVWLFKFWPAVNLTDCKFFRPFFGRSRGRNDLFFLNFWIFQINIFMLLCNFCMHFKFVQHFTFSITFNLSEINNRFIFESYFLKLIFLTEMDLGGICITLIFFSFQN